MEINHRENTNINKTTMRTSVYIVNLHFVFDKTEKKLMQGTLKKERERECLSGTNCFSMNVYLLKIPLAV